MDYQPAPEGKDPLLWQLAHKRASFKRHLSVYIVMNIFFWILWYFSKYKGSHTDFSGMKLPWPVWPMLGWGIGLVFHYIGAYVSTGENSVLKEYDKLSQNKNKQL